MHLYVYCSIFYSSQGMETAYVSIDRQMDKEDWGGEYIMEYYTAIKRDEIVPFETMWMDLEDIMLSECQRLGPLQKI